MLSEVIQVIPTDDYKVYIYMDDNTVRLYDAAPLIAKGGIFKQIQDPEIFKNTCTILNDTLAWDLSGCMDGINCIDICPDTLRECPEVENIEQIEIKLFA